MKRKDYVFYRSPKEKAVRGLKIFAAVCIPLAVVVFVVLGIALGWFSRWFEKDKYLDGDYEALFAEKKYDLATEITAEILAADPFNKKALIYDGFANYYYGMQLPAFEDQLPYLDRAALSLRKVRILDEKHLTGKIDYFLGRIYYIKGTFFLDEAIVYFESALDLGYKDHRNEICYFLGMAYSRIGLFDKSLEWLKQVEGDSDVSRLLIAITYFHQKNYASTLENLDRILQETQDEEVKLSCIFWKAKTFLEQNNYEQAISLYNEILAKVDSADVHYQLGLVYKEMNNIIQARSEWRKAIKLQPTHMGALMELNQ